MEISIKLGGRRRKGRRRALVWPVIFLIGQVLVFECSAAPNSSRSPSTSSSSSSSPSPKEEWEESSSSNPSTSTSHPPTSTGGASPHRGAGSGSRRSSSSSSSKHYPKDGSVGQQHYMVEADTLEMGPAYEQSVNPFLFHLEQGWRLKPVRHRSLKKKWLQQQQQQSRLQPQPHHFPQHHQAGGNKHHNGGGGGGGHMDPNIAEELPMNPDKPHFVDSNEVTDADETRAFGDEEKDLRDLFQALFSPDY